MEILNIKRPNNGAPKTGLKVYATVLGDSGVEYKVGYFRRASFRGWMCSCPNFILSQFAKGGHCKHIDHVQDQYGRYGAAVTPSKQRPSPFKKDIRAIEKWGQDTGKAISEGKPAPDLSLPSQNQRPFVATLGPVIATYGDTTIQEYEDSVGLRNA